MKNTNGSLRDIFVDQKKLNETAHHHYSVRSTSRNVDGLINEDEKLNYD